MGLNVKNLLYIVLILLGGIALGGVVSAWAVSMGDSTRYVVKLWVTIWLSVLYFPMPRYRRDWMAHILGLGVAISLTLGWGVSKGHYPTLLNPIVQLLYGLFTISCQVGIIYLVSSPKYREVFRIWR